jgi:hypothetical protein
MNIVSENINANVELTVKEGDQIRKQILAKFDRGRESNESLTS